MAWIDKTPNGYVVRWREGGRRSPILTTPLIARKDQAVTTLARIEAEVAALGPVRRGGDLPLAEVLQRWKASRVARGARAIHLDKAMSRLSAMIKACGWDSCPDITTESIETWRAGGGSPRAGAYLRAVLRWASETIGQRVAPSVLVALRPRPTGRRPRPALVGARQIADWQALADAASPSAGALLHCLATYGWRPITAADLQVRHYDRERGMITTTVKGGDVVEHPVLPETIKRLTPLVKGRGPDDPLFIDPRTQEAWNPNASARGSIVRWCSELGLRSYDLKRWAISGMLRRGLPPQTVRLFTGHRTISQVLAYARTNEDEARAALSQLVPPPSTTEHQPTPARTRPAMTPQKTPAKTRMRTR